jgi:hypothetical protein
MRLIRMDFLDEVLNMEEKAFREGEESGKRKAEEIAKKESFSLGAENGFYIAREYGFIKGFTEIVDREEHLREKHQKIIQAILMIDINPTMPAEEINQKIETLRGLHKHLLSVLKIKHESASTDLY